MTRFKAISGWGFVIDVIAAIDVIDVIVRQIERRVHLPDKKEKVVV